MKFHDRKFWLIAAISIFLCMMFVDETAVAVTLPVIRQQLGLSAVGIQWVMNAMFLPLAVFVLFAGKLADHIGSRKVFMIGMALFLLASALCALAPSGWLLIVGRALQGFSASLMLATYAVLLSFVFPLNQRGLALGTCASIASIFLATGPFIGGFFTQYLSWRWIFAINIPLGLLSALIVFKVVAKDTPSDAQAPFDWRGLALFVLGFSALIYGLMQGVSFGWSSTVIISMFIIAAVLLPVFIWWQLKYRNPLAILQLFKIRNFWAGALILLATQVVVMSLVYWAIWLQESLGLSPLMAGVGLLPAGLPILIMARLGGTWLDQKGPRLPIGLGSVIVLVGIIWLAITAPLQSYWLAFWGFLAYGFGAPLIISPAIALVLSSVEVANRGVAAGMLNTMRQLGAAFCFGIIGAVITNMDHYRFSKLLLDYPSLSKPIHTIEQLLLDKQHLISYDQPLSQLISHAQHIHSLSFAWGMAVVGLFALTTTVLALKAIRN